MFRFSIRDLLWLMVVVGLALGWWSWWQSSPPPDATVSGAVSVNGQLLNDGRLCLHSAEGTIFGSSILKGQFAIPRVPIGDYRVTAEGSNVPVRFASTMAGLTVQVRSGVNRIDFDLSGN
jgi:hypothetical protein